MLWRTNNGHLHVGRNAYSNHATAHFRPQTNTRIESLGNNIDKPAFADELQSDIWVALFEHRKLGQKQFINSMLTGIDTYRVGGTVTIMSQRGEPIISIVKA